jgi:hypothetical protein
MFLRKEFMTHQEAIALNGKVIEYKTKGWAPMIGKVVANEHVVVIRHLIDPENNVESRFSIAKNNPKMDESLASIDLFQKSHNS